MEENRKKNSYWIMIVWFSTVILMWILSWIYVDYTIQESAARGAFGDKFGFINALFSGLAFAGVIYTIYLQRAELELQRKEIRQSTFELKGQKESMNFQRFENKFFQLVKIYFDNLSDLNINIDYLGMQRKTTLHGREFFKELAIEVGRRYYQNIWDEKTNLDLIFIYNDLYNTYRNELGHYFRNLFNIFKYIDSTPELKSDEERSFYTKIIRAQLSNYELVILCYNGISNRGLAFQKYINKYEILKNIDFELEVDITRRARGITLFEEIDKYYPHLKKSYETQIKWNNAT